MTQDDAGTDRNDGRDGDPRNDDRWRRLLAATDDESVFATLTGHFYRGQMSRVTTWRSRLDQTTNWAVIVMAGVLTWTFSSPDHPHYVLLIGFGAVLVFLFVEAQRFREYDAWRVRVRTLEDRFFGPFYGDDGADGDWLSWLGRDLDEPAYRITLWWATGHRLQHVYLPLVTVLLAAWLVRVSIFVPERSIARTAAVGGVDGTIVTLAVLVAYAVLVVATLLSARYGTRREFSVGTG